MNEPQAERGLALVKWLEQIMVGFGAEWVLWLLITLSVVSVAIILERLWFFMSLRDDLTVLARDLRVALENSVDAAKRRLEASPSAEAAVVVAGLAMVDRGHEAAEEAMAGAAALQRMKLEKRLAYLATLGNNAPFIGLFGTVIGILAAFRALGKPALEQVASVAVGAQQPLAPTSVMSALSEALVATAVGIAVAIPAVAANNFFQRWIKSILANTEALSKVLLAHMKATPLPEGVPRSQRSAESSRREPETRKAARKLDADLDALDGAPHPRAEPAEEGEG